MRVLFVTLLLVLGISSVQARLIPAIPNTSGTTSVDLQEIEVKKHKVDVDIQGTIATTTIETVFHNPNKQVLEGTYLFALPEGASVAKFSLWIDGKEMPAELLDADKAEKLYLKIVRQMIDPALLEFVGRETFKLRIFPLPANGERKIKLSYQQVLPYDNKMLRYEYPLTAVGNDREDTIKDFSMKIKISGQKNLQSVFSPTHDVKISKEGSEASLEWQEEKLTTDRDFVLYLSHSDKEVDLSFIPFAEEGEEGYFLLLLTPDTNLSRSDVNPKDIVFVMDTSGSMVGDKMDQAKKALKYCLQQLNPQDSFAMVTFSTEASYYKDKLMSASSENVKKAVSFVDSEIMARGGTNLEEALQKALKLSSSESKRPFMVVLVADGKPTIGVIDDKQIIKNVKENRPDNLRLFSLGIGERLSTKLLDRLAEENRGTRDYIGTKEDIELRISNFVDKISFPVMSDLKIEFPSQEGLTIKEVYPKEISDLFKGSRLAIAGRYKGEGEQAIRLTGVLNEQQKEFVYEVSFPKKQEKNESIPRLWAIRKVGYLLDQMRLNGENEELKKEVVRLAKKFGIVTPYTSYLVVEDEPTVVQNPGTPNPPVRPFPIPRDTNTGGSDDQGSATYETFSESVAKGKKDRFARSMREESGEAAVEASKEFERMKKAQGVYKLDQEGQQTSNVRHVAYKTFYQHQGVWYDSEYLNKVANASTTVEPKKLSYLSEEYLDFLKDNPGVGKFLAIGQKVVVWWQGQAYQVTAQ